MGQSTSSAAISSTRSRHHSSHRSNAETTAPIYSSMRPKEKVVDETCSTVNGGVYDYSANLPDECLAYVFQSLCSGDRKLCSLVCRRWLQIEGLSRNRLSLDAQSDLTPLIPSLFARFDTVTKLALKCDRRSISIGDEALIQISLRCRNLVRLKLRACRELTDSGMIPFAKNCRQLKKLSCGSCAFGARGMNAVLDNCSSLEELSVKRLRGIENGAEMIGPGVASTSLKSICLKELYNGHCFGPLIIGAKNLRTLMLFRCSGDWDKLLKLLANQETKIVDIHLERLQVSDIGLSAIANSQDLEILHLVKTPECTNAGLVMVAERCKLLRKLHIDGWKASRIGDEGLIAVAKSCPKLQELVLVGVNPTCLSLEILASNCLNLERLALCASETVGDAEMSCIATKCIALKKLCIKNCPISDHGMEALSNGCPNLVKVKVMKCRAVTSDAADWFRASRGSVAVTIDIDEIERQDANGASDVEAQENDVESPTILNHSGPANFASNGSVRSASFKARLSHFGSKYIAACTIGRWASMGSSSRNN